MKSGNSVFALVLVAATAATVSPIKAQAEVQAPAHTRIVTEPFADDKVVRIDGRQGTQATIRFGSDEKIENVAIGDSVKWQVTPNKRADLLFVKPLEPVARTNMTVITNKHDYFFELVASPTAKAIYMLRFAYANEAADQQPSTGEAKAVPVAVQASAPPSGPIVAWKGKGTSRLFPARIYDDGKSTYLTWLEDTSIPAIFVTDDEGQEGPVNYAVHGAMIVIPYVPRQIVLRSGKDAATLRPQQRTAEVVPVEAGAKAARFAQVGASAMDSHQDGTR